MRFVPACSLHIVFSAVVFFSFVFFFFFSVFQLKLPSVAPITAYSLWLLIPPFLHVTLVVFFHRINKILLSICSCLFFCLLYIYIVILRYSNWLWQFRELSTCLWGSFSSLFLCCFWLMLCLIVMAGFKVGGGEAVLAKDQSGTSWEGISH